jgi:hypothetical protein
MSGSRIACCTYEGRTHRFKLRLGSREEPLWRYRAQESSTKTDTPSPDDSKYFWCPRILKRFPAPIANFVGPRVVRQIP